MTAWNLQILGQFRLSDGDGTEIRLPTKHDRAVLAYLALSTARITRDGLATLIWEDRQLEQARHSLSGSLRALRGAFGDRNGAVIVPNSDPLSYDLSAINVDAVAFKQLCDKGTRETLERAETLYRGDLLHELQLNSTGFEDWVIIERQHFRDRLIDALGRLMVIHDTAGDADNASRAARRLLELDELQEKAHRFLILDQLVRGSRATALKQVGRCESTLKTAGVAPEPETARLFAEVRGRASIDVQAYSDGEQRLNPPDKPSIAVLAFDNLSGDPGQQYIIDGIAEDIITELSKFHSLFVIARNSSFQYRGKTVDIKRVGCELGVHYIVEGSFRRSDDRVRIAVQLIDVSTGAHLWANQYDRNLRDIFEVQDDVSRRIVATLAVRLEVHELALAKRKPPGSMKAYDLWLHGKKCLDAHTAESFAEARRLFEKAIAVDVTYARAYSGLSYVYNMAPFYSNWGGARPDHEQAFASAQRAVFLDQTDHLPHIILGWCQLWRRNYGEATREFELAFEMNPNDADALAYRGFYQIYVGDPESAVETVRMAIRLNPHRPDWYIAHLVCAHFMARQYGEAISASDGLRDVWPEYSAWMASLLAHAGRQEEARHRAATFVANVRQIWTGDAAAGAKEFVQWMLNGNPFRREADVDHLRSGLCKAGLIQ